MHTAKAQQLTRANHTITLGSTPHLQAWTIPVNLAVWAHGPHPLILLGCRCRRRKRRRQVSCQQLNIPLCAHPCAQPCRAMHESKRKCACQGLGCCEARLPAESSEAKPSPASLSSSFVTKTTLSLAAAIVPRTHTRAHSQCSQERTDWGPGCIIAQSMEKGTTCFHN